jgi:single-stranded DNA-binding protein
MTLHALASGSLWEAPERRQSKNGNSFVLASLKVKVGAEETRTVKVLAFSESVQDELMQLRHGDALSVTGSFKAEIYTPENRGPRLNLTIFAESVLPLRVEPKPI